MLVFWVISRKLIFRCRHHVGNENIWNFFCCENLVLRKYRFVSVYFRLQPAIFNFPHHYFRLLWRVIFFCSFQICFGRTFNSLIKTYDIFRERRRGRRRRSSRRQKSQVDPLHSTLFLFLLYWQFEVLRFRLDPIFKISYITGTYCMIFQNLCYISLVEIDPLVKTRKLEVEPPFFQLRLQPKRPTPAPVSQHLLGNYFFFFL